MKVCQLHFDKLKEAMDVRGLGHLVRKDDANDVIFPHTVRDGGIYLMSSIEAGNERCSLCELKNATERITEIAEESSHYCQHNGFTSREVVERNISRWH